ncbi:MAG: hypothetical protein R3D02_10450 [Hyphomicrobiales bacterium]
MNLRSIDAERDAAHDHWKYRENSTATLPRSARKTPQQLANFLQHGDCFACYVGPGRYISTTDCRRASRVRIAKVFIRRQVRKNYVELFKNEYFGDFIKFAERSLETVNPVAALASDQATERSGIDICSDASAMTRRASVPPPSRAPERNRRDAAGQCRVPP